MIEYLPMVTLLSRQTKNAFPNGKTFSDTIRLFGYFFTQHIPKENTQIIPAAIENAIHKDIVAVGTIKSQVVSAH